MTLDERDAKGPGPAGERDGMPSRRTTAGDIERYAGLFARRTHGMTSSAMRDLMAVTNRPEVISLAGGLPDTSTFPPELFSSLMSKVGAALERPALQYGPTEGLPRRWTASSR
jgi:2-aminoadipate transaminase